MPSTMMSPTLPPSTAALTMPPACPAPSPAGYRPRSDTLSRLSASRKICTGEDVRVSTPCNNASVAVSNYYLPINLFQQQWYMPGVMNPGSSSSNRSKAARNAWTQRPVSATYSMDKGGRRVRLVAPLFGTPLTHLSDVRGVYLVTGRRPHAQPVAGGG